MSGEALRIANISGFYGDRLSAAREMVFPAHPDARPVDVLTGDYLAELTMMILLKDRGRDPNGGYARTFLRQLRDVGQACAEQGIKIVTNAGGLNPRGCAEACRRVIEGLELTPEHAERLRVAHIEGDDLLDRLDELQQAGEELRHLDRDLPLSELDHEVLSANAYLGAWGIVEAMNRDAGVVVCPRVTDASVVVGPAAWRFGWARDDWDPLAGAVLAGHIIECSTQATGGNYTFFDELHDMRRPGFPIAEIEADGSFVITKHPGTGGAVTVGTVTAQLLYEIQSERYLNPDVVVRLDTVRLEQEGPDRVRVWGVRGEPAPDRLKVCMNYLGGHKNSVTLQLSGPRQAEKAKLADEQFWGFLAGPEVWRSVESGEDLDRSPAELGRARFSETASHLKAGGAFSLLTLAARDPDEKKLSRGFWNAAVEMALASYPGFHFVSSSRAASEVTVYWPALVDRQHVDERVVWLDAEGRERELQVAAPSSPAGFSAGAVAAVEPVPVGGAFYRVDARGDDPAFLAAVEEATDAARLGDFLGGRSGDKGGNCNVGIWARSVAGYEWMLEHLDTDWLRSAYPEARDLEVDRYELPGLLAVNFVIRALLGEGVSASLRPDPQAKMVAEELLGTGLPTR